jgi:hypothetical protein
MRGAGNCCGTSGRCRDVLRTEDSRELSRCCFGWRRRRGGWRRGLGNPRRNRSRSSWWRACRRASASNLPTGSANGAGIRAIGVDLIDPCLQAAKRRDEQRDDDCYSFDLGDLDDLFRGVLRQFAQSVDQALVFNDRQPIEIVHHHRATESNLLRDVRSRAMLGQQFMNSVASREVGACHRA